MNEDDRRLVHTTRWLIKRFGQYYTRASIELPKRYTRREWGFLFFDKSFMIRHIDFNNKSQIFNYFEREIPRHIYYSTAYYDNPGAKNMSEKKWQGSTLVFDLDADHLKNIENKSYSEMLNEVKREFIKLVDDWLVNKLGFDYENIQLVFSGGRGYHAHIEDPRVLGLNTYERREIIDMITGKIDLKDYIHEKTFDVGHRKEGKNYRKQTFILPSPELGDWKGDLSNRIIEFFHNTNKLIEEGKRNEAITNIAEMWHLSIEEAEQRLDDFLEKEGISQRRIDRLLNPIDNEHRIDFWDGKNYNYWRPFCINLFVESIGEADEPVTSDIKRLIRLPGSLHGKTGFKVVKMTRDELSSFNPLTDALAFSGDITEIECLQDYLIEINGESYELKAEKRIKIPEHAAVFACLRGMAQIADD